MSEPNRTTKLGSEPIESKYQCPTEILKLPSEGWFYPENNILSSGEVEMKYMTAKEEDILTTQSYIASGVVLDKLFQSMIVTKINFDDLLVCDKNGIMITARILGYGKDYEVNVTTPSGNKQLVKIDLTTLGNVKFHFDEYEKGKNAFSYQLPTSKRVIVYKMLTHGDQKKLDLEIKQLKKVAGGQTDPTLSTRLKHSIISIDGNSDPAYIYNFVTHELLAIDSKALRIYMKLNTPDVDLTIEAVDEVTELPFSFTLPIGLDFFWPTT